MAQVPVDNRQVAGAVVLVVIVLVTVAMSMRWSLSRRISPERVVRHLRRHPDTTFTARVDGVSSEAWDPMPRPSGSTAFPYIYGRGTATYRLTGDGYVELTYVKKDGSTRRTHGPIPARLTRGTPEAARWAHVRRQLWLVLILYPAAFGAGFLIGYASSATSHALRVQHGFIGGGAGVTAAAIGLHGIAIAIGIRHRAAANQGRSYATSGRVQD
jgi:hypothetical protein